ncbi:MAG: hypothetical protein EA345_15930 [Halomonas sp.]|nr:MAG: hypothetical protein EA345_15930 [Halomonas sp.]
MVVFGGALSWRAYLRQPQGELYFTSTASQFHARWRLKGGQHGSAKSDAVLSDEYPVRCDYLGPWLIGLYIGKQRVWLWPDSSPSNNLREVRKLLHRPGR